MEFAAIRARALAVRALYTAYEERRYGRSWTLEELVLGLVGDVGDLAKLMQAREGVRDMDNSQRALAHELADLLWAVVVIAEQCEVDLEAAFTNTMDELERSLSEARDAPDAMNRDNTARDEPPASG